MHAARQHRILRELFALVDHDTTQLADAPFFNPTSAYVSEDVFAAEQARLLRARPVFVCMSADVAEAGSYFATESGGVPILVVRDRAGALHGHLNVCRHRGSPLVPDGAGQVSRGFTCGFHGWVYGIDGTQIGQPYSGGGFDGLDASCTSLVPIPVAERHGLVFARAEGQGPIDLDVQLAGMGEELAEFEFGTYRRFDEWQSSWNANWKLLIETFLETYHVPTLHRDTVAKYYLARPSMFASFGPNLRFHSLMKSVVDQRTRPEAEWDLVAHGTIEYLLAPNAVLNFSVDHLAVYRFLPSAADRTDVVLTIYTPPGEAAKGDEHYRRTLALHERVSGGQDFPKQETVQTALRSGRLDHVVFGRNEPAAIAFHRSIGALVQAPQGDT